MLSPEIPSSAIEEELDAVFRLYAGLSGSLDPELGLGGKLLFAGELNPAACRLIRAANIAGAASLAATADAAQARQAMRDSVIDFVVNSLDEALRILKNGIRKRQPVAVCVTCASEAIVAEMQDRGVQPDLLPPLPPSAAAPDYASFFAQGAQPVHEQPHVDGLKFLVIAMPPAWAQREAAFDALLLDSLSPDDHLNRRWLRLSPRYLGSQARRLRSLACTEATASRLLDSIGKPIPDR